MTFFCVEVAHKSYLEGLNGGGALTCLRLNFRLLTVDG